jgi:cytochrome b
MKKGKHNTLFALIGLVIAIVVAFLIAAYVSNNKNVVHMQYGNKIIHQPMGNNAKQ